MFITLDGKQYKPTAILCLGAHLQYSFVIFNSSLTNTPVVSVQKLTVISLQNYPFPTGLSMLTLKGNMYPNFGQEHLLGRKRGGGGTGTDASIEMQQFEQKRFQDVALTHTEKKMFLLKDCFPSAEGDA